MTTLKSWNLFIDDLRDVSYISRPDLTFEIARSYEEAVALCEKFECLPSYISFDHDLGWDSCVPFFGSSILAPVEPGSAAKSGYDFALYFVDSVLDGKYKVPKNFSYTIHSSNPSGKVNINSLLTNFLNHVNRNKDLFSVA